jgi:hypothetical protein
MTIIDVESIIQELNNIDLSKDYPKKSFMQIVNEKCKKHTKKKKKNLGDKEKKLTAYNQFVKENMSIVKEKYKELTPKQHMSKLGELWQQQKLKLI